MFQRTRSLLRHLAGGDRPEDRRVHPRFDTDVQTTCRSVCDDGDINARIRNVSRSGANILMDREIPQGTMVRIDLPCKGGHHTTVLACAMHAREESPGAWSIGCMFSLELTDDEMKLFGGEKKKPNVQDQRAWVRFPAKGMVEFRVLPGDTQPGQLADLVDISPAGIGLIVDQQLEPGMAMSIALRRRQGTGPDLAMLACVVYRTDHSPGKWAVGCNFIRELSNREIEEIV